MQSPSWEANWFAATQEIPRISRNPKVHYRTHKRPPPISILGQPNPVHIPTSHLLEIRPNIINPSTHNNNSNVMDTKMRFAPAWRVLNTFFRRSIWRFVYKVYRVNRMTNVSERDIYIYIYTYITTRLHFLEYLKSSFLQDSRIFWMWRICQYW